MTTTVIVVPCYNEARRLDEHSFLNLVTAEPEIRLLFVDDGSVDETFAVLRRLHEIRPRQIAVLRLQPNRGKAEAVRRGMSYALTQRTAFAGYWDADLATPLDEIPRFRDVLLRRPEIAVVLGTRIPLSGHLIRRRGVRRLLSWTLSTLVAGLFDLSIRDTQCGAKIFRSSTETRDLFRAPFRSRWLFDVELLTRLQRLSVQPLNEIAYEHPIDSWTDIPGSKLGPSQMLLALRDLAAMRLAHFRSVSSSVEPSPQSSAGVANDFMTPNLLTWKPAGPSDFARPARTAVDVFPIREAA